MLRLIQCSRDLQLNHGMSHINLITCNVVHLVTFLKLGSIVMVTDVYARLSWVSCLSFFKVFSLHLSAMRWMQCLPFSKHACVYPTIWHKIAQLSCTMGGTFLCKHDPVIIICTYNMKIAPECNKALDQVWKCLYVLTSDLQPGKALNKTFKFGRTTWNFQLLFLCQLFQ